MSEIFSLSKKSRQRETFRCAVKLNYIFSGGMYGGKNTLIGTSVDRREACSPDVILSKNLFFDSLKPPGKGPAANGHNYIYTIILESP